MDYTYHPQNVCPMEIRFRLEDDTVHDIRFVGGCNGNLKAISKLGDGRTGEKIESDLKGNNRGRRPASCADQLAIAVRAAYDGQE